MVNAIQFIVITVLASCSNHTDCADILSALYSPSVTGEYHYHHRPSRSSVEAVVTPNLKASKSHHYFDHITHNPESTRVPTAIQPQTPSYGVDNSESTVNSNTVYNYYFYSAVELTEDEKRRTTGPCGVQNTNGYRFKTYLATGVYVYALKSYMNKNRVVCNIQNRALIYLADNSDATCQL